MAHPWCQGTSGYPETNPMSYTTSPTFHQPPPQNIRWSVSSPSSRPAPPYAARRDTNGSSYSDDSGSTTESSYSYTSMATRRTSSSTSSQASASTDMTMPSEGPPAFDPPFGAQYIPSPFNLPCEFHRTMNCTEVFDASEVEEWIQHVRSHLNNVPARLKCLFCDDFVFDCNEPRNGERYDEEDNFENRMQHSVGHLQRGEVHPPYRPDFYRPDFLMEDHLKKVEHQIPDSDPRTRSEMSAEYESVARNIFHLGYITPEQQMSQRRQSMFPVQEGRRNRRPRRQR